jgi:RES domain.
MSYKNPEITRKFLSEIQSHIDQMNYDQIKTLCNATLPSIPVNVVEFKNENFSFRQMQLGGINGVYRAREINNYENTPFKTVSEISYIPEDKKDKLKYYGRANKPFEPMFYGAFDYTTACAESITNADEFLKKGSTMFTVGLWKFETPLILAELPHSEKNFKKFYETVNFKPERIQLEHIQKANLESKIHYRNGIEFEIAIFFADEFARFDSEKEHNYKLSNYYTDRIFNRINGFELPFDIDGIIYPSVTQSYQHKNIVLKPEVVDKKLKFINAMQVWLVSHKETSGGAQFIPIRQHIKADKDGNLLWI